MQSVDRVLGTEAGSAFSETVASAALSQRNFGATGLHKDRDESILLYRKAVEMLGVHVELEGIRAILLRQLALGIRARFVGGHSDRDLDEAIAMLRQAAQVETNDRAICLSDLGRTLWMRYVVGSNQADLDEAIYALQQALPIFEYGDSAVSDALINLGICLTDRFELSHDASDIESAVAVNEQAVERTPTGSDRRAANMNSLAISLSMRYGVTKKLADLRRAAALHKAAVDVISPDSPERLTLLNNLIAQYRQLWRESAGAEGLDELIDGYRRILSLDDGLEKTADIMDFVRLTLTRYRRTNTAGHLDASIDDMELALRLLPLGDSLDNVLVERGAALLERYEASGQAEDLDAAALDIKQGQSALVEQPNAKGLYYRLAQAFAERAQNRNASDLREATANFKRAMQGLPPDDPLTRNCILQVVVNLSRLGEIDNSEETLDGLLDAIRVAEATLDATRDDAHIFLQLTKASALVRDYRLHGSIDDLDVAIQLCRSISSSVDFRAAHPALAYLGDALGERFEAKGEIGDLTEGIAALQRGLESESSEQDLRSEMLNTLGALLRQRHLALGEAGDLDAAIKCCQEAVDSTSADSPARPARLGGLSNALYDRYERSGDLDLLDRAISGWQIAADLTTESAWRATRLCNLGDGLRLRFQQTGNPDDLNASIRNLREALDLTGATSPEYVRYAYFLSAALLRQHLLTDEADPLDEAIRLLDASFALGPASSNLHRLTQIQLGQLLRVRYEREKSETDLLRATKLAQDAVVEAAENATALPGALFNLGYCYKLSYSRSSRLEDIQRAVNAWREACVRGLEINLETALDASLGWGDWASEREEWTEAAEAYGYGMKATKRLFETQVLREHKESWLEKSERLPVLAAYAYAKSGDLRTAVVVIEEGRARLLAQALMLARRSIEQLRAGEHANLYRAYHDAAERLQILQRKELSGVQGAGWLDFGTEMRTARDALYFAIRQIEQVKGYEHVFESPGYDTIRQYLLASDRPESTPLAAVYFAVLEREGFALVLHSDGVDVVWLEATDEELLDILVGRSDGDRTDGYLSAQRTFAPFQTAIDEMKRWLSGRVVGPVAVFLDTLPGPARPNSTSLKPEIVLIPTGLLSLLPLTAADFSRARVDLSFLDHFAASYAPSATALGASRAAVAGIAVDAVRSMIAVGNPLPLSARYASLTFGAGEAKAVATLAGEDARLYVESSATLDVIEVGLSNVRYLHFACHGVFEPEEPLDSGLVLGADRRLTLGSILATKPGSDARLATLSACQTALVDYQALPNEAIGLPAGLLQLGFPGVVGSLWPVTDFSTAVFMLRFYELLWDGSREIRPTQALRLAQTWLRDVTNRELSAELDPLAGAGQAAVAITEGGLAWQQLANFALGDPDETPFAHPYYWAGFVLCGI